MPRAHSPSNIARIRKITDLREKLGYGDETLSRCAAFADDLRGFRRRYRAFGLRGTDFCDRKSSKHQDGLKQMTTSFLDENGYGELYWPSDPIAANFNSLQYSKDRTFITAMLRQLIFRTNLQQYRNEKYKKNKRQAESDVPEIIDLEDETYDYASEGSIGPENRFNSPITTTTTQTYTDLPNADIAATSLESNLKQQQHDTCEALLSPNTVPEPNPKLSTTKRQLQIPSRANPQKRSKIVTLQVAAVTRPSRQLGSIAPVPKRTSPRARKTVQRPGYADILGLDQAINSNTEPTFDANDDTRAPNRTSAQDRSEHIEDVLHYIRTNRPSIVGEGVPSTHDYNIDPEPSRNPSPAFSMNVPTHRPLHRSRSNSSTNFRAHVASSSKCQPEVEKSLSPTHTLSTVDSTYGTTQTPTSSTPFLNLGESQGPAKQVNESSLPATILRPKAASAEDSKAVITFNYIVILSRTPKYQYKSWKPKGHFLEKSLSELIDELPFDNKRGITGLVIGLTSHGVDVKETLERGQDANYNSTKRRFMQTVKTCLKNHNRAGLRSILVVDFEIEAVREGIVDEDDADDDDDIVF